MKRITFGALLAALGLLAAGCGIGGETEVASETPPAVAVPEADDGHDHEHGPGAVDSATSDVIDPAFDLVVTSVRVEGDEVVFRSTVVGGAGPVPDSVGELDGAAVHAYVWPTSLNSSTIGFEADQGILALAATSHPDFDDTPLYDEDGDGDLTNDGRLWHTHWVVLTDSPQCVGGLSVRDIPDGETPALPETWPELPILLDSPDIATAVADDRIEIRVPISEVGPDLDFGFDGVTSGLRVSTSPHDPLLCVDDVFDVASGDLSLPGTVDQ